MWYKQLLLCGFSMLIFFVSMKTGQGQPEITVSDIGLGWSRTSINAPIFRKNSIVSANGYQFVAYYDNDGFVVLAKRKLGTNSWEASKTQYKGNVSDAHNSISIMVDGDGFLHMSWDLHNNPLNYCKSLNPFSTKLGDKEKMIGLNEQVVSYPEFYRFSNGDLLFANREGGSGNGNLVLNKYIVKERRWQRLQSNLIDGEGKRNAYWQIHIDSSDRVLVSWVWRNTPDVATNHNMCFARSDDGGQTWKNSVGEVYGIPINYQNAEVIWPIPQNSNLINQTSMTTDPDGNIYIATYYRLNADKTTNYQLIYNIGGEWKHCEITNRNNDFNLSGIGSRNIPISRPQILTKGSGNKQKLYMVYRDEEMDNHVCIASAFVNEMEWGSTIISPYQVSRWEPSFDTELWKNSQQLHLYFQNVGQGQAEGVVEMDPQMVSVLEIMNL
jgi:hypothetical protein